MEISLKNKTAIITGGTRGIGLATVQKFLEAGAQVIFLGSRQETVEKAERSLNHPHVKGYVVNANDNQEIESFVEKIKAEYGHIDILINNAGISDSTPFAQYDDQLFEKVMEINVLFLVRMSKAVAKVMMEQGEGVILNTSSMVSQNGQPSGVAYPASKFAVNGITLSLARELGKYHIRVNAVAPGVTRTDMVKALPEEKVKQLASTIPLGRLGEAEDIANAFLFLASDMASYISGTILKVDGATIV